MRGLAVLKADQQLQSLLDAMNKMQGAVAEAVVVWIVHNLGITQWIYTLLTNSEDE